MTLEQKWDLLWPLACAVSAAIERYDGETPPTLAKEQETLAWACRQLKKAVDHISPEPTNV
jgi:hypothetical protein